MISEMKPGRYRMRNGSTVIVKDRNGHPSDPWTGHEHEGVRYCWRDDGRWIDSATPAIFDLVEYLGPEQAV